MKIVLFFIAFIYLFFSTGCPKSCTDTNYTLLMNVKFYPEKDSINVNDTIWMKCFHSNIFKDQNSDKQINFKNTLLGTNIRILHIDGMYSDTIRPIGGIPDFKVTAIKGNFIGKTNLPDENKGFNFEQEEDVYKLELAFIPKHEGTYAISVGNTFGTIVNENDCKRASVSIMNVNENNHLYLYQSYRPGYTISDYEENHLYCFAVK